MKKIILIFIQTLFSFTFFAQIDNGNFMNFDDNPDNEWESWTTTGTWGGVPPDRALTDIPFGLIATLKQEFHCEGEDNEEICWIKFEVFNFANVKAEVQFGGGTASIPGVGKYKIKSRGCGDKIIKYKIEKIVDDNRFTLFAIDDVMSACNKNEPDGFGDDYTPLPSLFLVPTLSQWGIIILALLLLIIGTIGINNRLLETQTNNAKFS